MPPAPSPDVSTVDQASLEIFTTDLIEAGFRPRDGDRHQWIGPVNPAFSSLTPAEEMRIEIRDGWPHRHPYLFVDGLAGRRHVNPYGNVCLWDEADDGYSWLRLDEVQDRIAAWCAEQAAGSGDPVLDTHLYFGGRPTGQLVVLDLDDLERRGIVSRVDGSHGRLRADFSNGHYRVATKGALEVAWFRQTRLTAPPANWTAFRSALTKSQQADLDKLSRGGTHSRSAIALLIWHDGPATAVMAVRLKWATPGHFYSDALEVGLNTTSVLALRAGPDWSMLQGKAVTLFGAGAIGSDLALLLARSGVGRLTLVDQELLRPGNLTRHAASPAYVGWSKVEAVKHTILDALPHVQITTVAAIAWEIKTARLLLEAGDLTIDATGNRAYARMLSRLATNLDPRRPMLSVALYRRGALARVSLQAGAEVAIADRCDSNGFPVVPAEPTALPEARWEPGCGARVNDAPPWAVAAAAALGARVAIDVLAGRSVEDRDLVDVYDPLPEAPFDVRGLQVFQPVAGFS
jgi:molybdopterin/thiamine biosynthesis adenylyltransferase